MPHRVDAVSRGEGAWTKHRVYKWTCFSEAGHYFIVMKDYNLILDTGFLTFMSYRPVCCLSYPCLDMCITSRAAAAMFRSHPGSPRSSHFKLSAVVTRSSLLRQNCNPHGKEVENTGHAVSEDCAAVTKKHFHARPQHGWGCLHRVVVSLWGTSLVHQPVIVKRKKRRKHMTDHFPEVINHSKVWKLPQREPTVITIGFIWHQVYVCSEVSLRSAVAKHRLPVRHLKVAAVLEAVQVCTVTQP